MSKQNILDIKRQIAGEVVRALYPGAGLYANLSASYEKDDDDFAEAVSQLRGHLERIAEPPIRMSAKRREELREWAKKRRLDRSNHD